MLRIFITNNYNINTTAITTTTIRFLSFFLFFDSFLLLLLFLSLILSFFLIFSSLLSTSHHFFFFLPLLCNFSLFFPLLLSLSFLLSFLLLCQKCQRFIRMIWLAAFSRGKRCDWYLKNDIVPHLPSLDYLWNVSYSYIRRRPWGGVLHRMMLVMRRMAFW